MGAVHVNPIYEDDVTAPTFAKAVGVFGIYAARTETEEEEGLFPIKFTA